MVAAPDGHRRHGTPHDERWPRIIRVEPLGLRTRILRWQSRTWMSVIPNKNSKQDINLKWKKRLDYSKLKSKNLE
jgi:hypothetical protein